jgi:hypothetical protein
MSDNPNVTNVVTTKTSNITHLTWFIIGVVFSAVVIYNIPTSVDLATGVVGYVVEKTPGVVSGVTGWVSETVNSIGSE